MDFKGMLKNSIEERLKDVLDDSCHQLTATKVAEKLNNGHILTGFVITDEWGNRTICEHSAGRHLNRDEMQWLMHESKSPLNKKEHVQVIKDYEEKLSKLKKAYDDVIWCGIRYANGRSTYAPSLVRESIKSFQEVFPDWKPRKDSVIKEDRERYEEYKAKNGDAIGLSSDWLDDLV